MNALGKPNMLKLSTAVVAGALAACSFYARSPEQYRNDTTTVLSAKSAELNSCYDGVLKTTPGASGKVTVHFTVQNKTGKITDVAADASNTTAPQPLIDCVVNAINGLTLTPPDQRIGDATFEYEFSAPTAPAPAASSGT